MQPSLCRCARRFTARVLFLLVFVLKRWMLDASLKYQLMRNLTFFADLANITSNHGKKYRGYVTLDLRNETNELGFVGTAGVQLSY